MPTVFDVTVNETNPNAAIQQFASARNTTQHDTSTTFLRIAARPDFVSHKPEIMASMPIVRFEIILDPLLLGVIPFSILGTLLLILATTLVGLKLIYPLILSILDDIIRGNRQKVVRITEEPQTESGLDSFRA